MPNFEIGGAKWELSQKEKDLLQKELKEEQSTLLKEEQRTILQQLQSTNVLYFQGESGKNYQTQIEGLDGYDCTGCDDFKQKIEKKYSNTAVVEGILAIRNVQLLCAKACENDNCPGTDVEELLKKGIIDYKRGDQTNKHFDGLAGPNFAKVLYELTKLGQGKTVMVDGKKIDVPLFNGELNDTIMEYLLGMARGNVVFEKAKDKNGKQVPPIVIPPVAQDTIIPPVAQDTIIPPVAQDTIIPPVAQDTIIPPVNSGGDLPEIDYSGDTETLDALKNSILSMENSEWVDWKSHEVWGVPVEFSSEIEFAERAKNLLTYINSAKSVFEEQFGIKAYGEGTNIFLKNKLGEILAMPEITQTISTENISLLAGYLNNTYAHIEETTIVPEEEPHIDSTEVTPPIDSTFVAPEVIPEDIIGISEADIGEKSVEEIILMTTILLQQYSEGLIDKETLMEKLLPSNTTVLASIYSDRYMTEELPGLIKTAQDPETKEFLTSLKDQHSLVRETNREKYEAIYSAIQAHPELGKETQEYNMSFISLPLADDEIVLPARENLHENHIDALDIFYKTATVENNEEVGPSITAMQGGIVIAASSNWKGDVSNDGKSVNYHGGGLSPKSGNAVVVYSPSTGDYTVYSHLSTIDVQKGDIITPGRKLGTGGNTGLNARKVGHGKHIDVKMYNYQKNIPAYNDQDMTEKHQYSAWELYDRISNLKGNESIPSEIFFNNFKEPLQNR